MILDHPGHFPADASDDPKVGSKEEGQFKAKILEHDVCTGAIQVMKDFIVEAVNEEWIANIEDEVMGFTNKTPNEMLDHLYNRRGALEYVNTNEIRKECNAQWDTIEHVME